jgi:hypothetical protein
MLAFEVVGVLIEVVVVLIVFFVEVLIEIGEVDFLTFLFFLTPPTGTFLRVPPLVQCLLQALQK